MDVDVRCLGGNAIGMHAEHGLARCAPAAVVQHHVQERRLVAPRHPVHGGRLREQVGPVTADGHHQGIWLRELDSHCCATVVAQRSATARVKSPRLCAPHVLRDHVEIGNRFAHDDGVLTDGITQAGHQVFGGERLARLFALCHAALPVRVCGREPLAAPRDYFGIRLRTLQRQPGSAPMPAPHPPGIAAWRRCTTAASAP